MLFDYLWQSGCGREFLRFKQILEQFRLVFLMNQPMKARQFHGWLWQVYLLKYFKDHLRKATGMGKSSSPIQ